MKRTITILTVVLVTSVSALAEEPLSIEISPIDYDRGNARQLWENRDDIGINGWVEYDVEIEHEGYYVLRGHYKPNKSWPVSMLWDGVLITKRGFAKMTGPWVEEDQFSLYATKGKHVLRIEAKRSPLVKGLVFHSVPKGAIPRLTDKVKYVVDLVEDVRAALQTLDPGSKRDRAVNRWESLKVRAAALDPGKLETFDTIETLRDEVAQLRWDITALRFKTPPQAGKQVAVWTCNPMVKVFQDEPLPGRANLTDARIEACRNEYEPIQLCITSYDYQGPITVELSPLVHSSGQQTITSLDSRFVGYVPLHQESEVTHFRGMELPAMFPDPLILDDQVTLEPRQTQPVWITVKVPKDALPGDYQGDITVVTAGGRVSTQLNVKVHPMVIPDQINFWLGGWGGEHYQSEELGLESDSPEYFAFLKHTLVNRFEHRSRTYSDVRVWSALDLVKVTWKDGQYAYDYHLWDKFISLVEQTYRGQFRVICASFGANRAPNRAGLVFNARILNPDGSINEEKSFDHVFPDEPGYLEFIEDFFVNMQDHLRQKGWLENVYFKVKDETNVGKQLEHFRVVASHIKKVAPDIRLDATIGFPHMFEEDYIDLPIGDSEFFRKHPDLFQQEANKGREVWFYGGVGSIDTFSTLHERRVGWLGYRYDLKGYHRWAYAWIRNAWDNADLTTPRRTPGKIISAGRDFVVYLDEERGVLVDSMRWEILRETQEDYELLLMAEKSGLDSHAFCRQIVKAADNVETDPDRIYEVRHQLLTELSRKNVQVSRSSSRLQRDSR